MTLEKYESRNFHYYMHKQLLTHTHTRTEDSSVRTFSDIFFMALIITLLGLRLYFSEKMNKKAVWKDLKIPVQTFKTLGFEKAEKTCSPTTFRCLNHLHDNALQRYSGRCLNFMVAVLPAKAPLETKITFHFCLLSLIFNNPCLYLLNIGLDGWFLCNLLVYLYGCVS